MFKDETKKMSFENSKKFKFFFLKIIFFVYFESFWCVDLKNNFFKNKKHHFDAFQNEKHFEKQP